MASLHNIHIIRIDATKSNMVFIKNSICNSEIKNIIDVENIDWDMCNKKASSSRMIEVIELYNNGHKNVSDIHKIINDISYCTIYSYLLLGAEYHLCDYNPKDYILYRHTENKYKRKIICLTNMNVYDSVKAASEDVGLKRSSGIVGCCRGKQKTSGVDCNGNHLSWMYYDDYLSQNKNNKITKLAS